MIMGIFRQLSFRTFGLSLEGLSEFVKQGLVLRKPWRNERKPRFQPSS